LPSTAHTVFALPPRLAEKAAPARIGDDGARFAAIAAALASERDATELRRDELRRMPGTHGQAALERDLEVHRLSGRLRVLQRYGVDACLGRIVSGDGSALYIGRFGLTGAGGERLLVDWRTPAAEPFFAATLARPLGLRSRRRYRWSGGPPACATCSGRSRPIRTPSSAPTPAVRSSWTGVRAPGRRSWRCTGPPTSSTRTRGWARARAAC
jgi:hypothetical protein